MNCVPGLDMSYLLFHITFLLPAIACLLAIRPAMPRSAWWGLLTICILAFVYATPWDIYLVSRGIWTYPTERIVASVWGVPLEEYAFFVLQPIFTGLWLFSIWKRTPPIWAPHSAMLNSLGALFWLVVTLVGAVMMAAGWPQTQYFALILVWAGPILTLQTAVGGAQIWQNRRLLALAIWPSTLYLCIADRIAIGQGIWHITEGTSTGVMLLGLPVEEAIFFLLTNIMVVQGIVLFVWVADAAIFDRLRTQPATA